MLVPASISESNLYVRIYYYIFTGNFGVESYCRENIILCGVYVLYVHVRIFGGGKREISPYLSKCADIFLKVL